MLFTTSSPFRELFAVHLGRLSYITANVKLFWSPGKAGGLPRLVKDDAQLFGLFPERMADRIVQPDHVPVEDRAEPHPHQALIPDDAFEACGVLGIVRRVQAMAQ